MYINTAYGRLQRSQYDLCGKRDGFNECVKMLKDNLKGISEEHIHES